MMNFEDRCKSGERTVSTTVWQGRDEAEMRREAAEMRREAAGMRREAAGMRREAAGMRREAAELFPVQSL